MSEVVEASASPVKEDLSSLPAAVAGEQGLPNEGTDKSLGGSELTDMSSPNKTEDAAEASKVSEGEPTADETLGTEEAPSDVPVDAGKVAGEDEAPAPDESETAPLLSFAARADAEEKQSTPAATPEGEPDEPALATTAVEQAVGEAAGVSEVVEEAAEATVSLEEAAAEVADTVEETPEVPEPVVETASAAAIEETVLSTPATPVPVKKDTGSQQATPVPAAQPVSPAAAATPASPHPAADTLTSVYVTPENTPAKAPMPPATEEGVEETASPAAPAAEAVVSSEVESPLPEPRPVVVTAPSLALEADEAEDEAKTPTVSVKDLMKRLTNTDSPTASNGHVNTFKAAGSPKGSKAASPTKLVPQAQRITKEVAGVPAAAAVLMEHRSEHDQHNTADAAATIQLGVFKYQPLQDFIPYDDLVKLRLEDGIDPTRKEDYLTEEEFVQVLGMSRDEFSKLSAWRRAETKKKKMLF